MAIAFRYGPAAAQVVDLHLPTSAVAGDRPAAADGGRFPVVVLIHGGFWRPQYDRSLMEPLARDLAGRGVAAWNIDYRGSGAVGGGWPGTFDDVATAVDRLAGAAVDHPLDLDRVVTVGHSAGGHLALWSAARPGLPAGTPGSAPAVRIGGAVSLAGVADLVAGFDEGLGSGAVEALMGSGPDGDPAAYALASPLARLPLGVPQLLVHGTDDTIVPVSQSTGHATAAEAAGDAIELALIDGADHFDVIDPAHVAWSKVIDRLGALAS